MTAQKLGPQPLDGVKVLEIGTLIAGPYCARLLGEFGADVIKIEAPEGGDQIRQWRKMHKGTSLWWSVQARNKRSVTCDMRTPEGQEIVRRLARTVDIVVENFRPGALEKWGIGWDVLSAANPGLVMVRLSGYGQTGPYKDRPGFGVVGEAMGGMRYVTGYPDRPPVRLGISIGDTIASLYGAFGAMSALWNRRVNGGRGQVVDVALYEAVFATMESLIPEFDVQGFIRERSGNTLPGIAITNTYRTRDDKYVIIGANNDAIFKRLMKKMGRDDLAEDPGLARNEGRVAREPEVDAIIADWAARHDLDPLLAMLDEAGVPSGKVYSAKDILSDPQYLARGMLEQHRLPDGTPIKLPGIVPRLTDTPGATRWLGPALGAHTDEALAAVGYDAATIADLRARRVI
jgi:formyl-CoA transferase